MDYNVLVASKSPAGSIANWVNHSGAQAAAPSIIEEAESFIYRRLRHWKMLTETTGTFTIDQDYITTPSDYLEDKTLYITGTNFKRIVRKTLEQVKANYSYDGDGNRVSQCPNIFYNNSSQIKFDSPSDQEYPYELTYYQQLAALSASNSTNFLTTIYPRLMRCACMVGASEFMKDSGAGNYDRTYWEQMTLAEIEIAQAESDHSQRSIEVGAIMI